nr:helix-turn-helix transcriptional regulator [Advenella kashmirensis]
MTQTTVGGLIRDWRQRRRYSQLDLACLANISARHLSFMETGRAQPSRQMLLLLAEHLDIPCGGVTNCCCAPDMPRIMPNTR